jgi:tetratricopeptide (TPR) repeat protein
MGRYEDARAQFEKTIASDPFDADAWAYRAEALSLAGRTEEAVTAINRAMAMEPQERLFKGIEFRILSRAGRTTGDLEGDPELARQLVLS